MRAWSLAPRALVLSAALAALAAFGPAAAQSPQPPAAPAPDPAYDAAQKVFDAMPEADRRAVQEALIWTGDFTSVVSGAYGRRTQAAINAYAKRLNLPQNGLLDDEARAALAASAANAKKAVGFAPAIDKASGVVVGVPGKLLSKITPGPHGVRYGAPDGSASLETFALPPADGDLPAAFDRLKADQPGRKVGYKLLRPDFLVVTGEAAGQTFYTRVAKGGEGLRGYTLSYAPAAKAVYDKISIAVANTFEPFGPSPAPIAAAPGPAAPALAATPAAPAAARPMLETTGLILAPGRVVAALPHSGCVDPATARVKLRLVRQDEATGLALLEAPGAAAKPLAASAAGEGPAVALFFQSAGVGGGQAQLAAAAGDVFSSAPTRLRAPLSGGQTGAVVFDRAGALIGLLRARSAQVAGPAAPASYELIAASAALGLAGAAAAPAAGATRTVGEIVQGAGALVTPIFCTR